MKMSDCNGKNKHIIDNISFSKIDQSFTHGCGLFATQDITDGTILGFLDGQIMDWSHYNMLLNDMKSKLTIPLHEYFFMEWNAIDKDTLLVRSLRTKYSYINHSKEPNVKVAYNPMRILSSKNIRNGDEILIDYTKEKLSTRYLNDPNTSFIN